MIVLAIRVCGGTFEQFEDELTQPRLDAILRSMRECPPTHVAVSRIALWAGAMKIEEFERSSAQKEKGAISFISAFGGSGGM